MLSSGRNSSLKHQKFFSSSAWNVSSTAAGGWDKRPTSNTVTHRGGQSACAGKKLRGAPCPLGPLAPTSLHLLPPSWLIWHVTEHEEVRLSCFKKGFLLHILKCLVPGGTSGTEACIDLLALHLLSELRQVPSCACSGLYLEDWWVLAPAS